MKAQEKQTVADKDEYRWYSTPWVNNSAVPKHAPNSLPKLGGSGDRILPPTIDLCQLQLSLGILQLDPADRAVIKIADRRDAIQKKAFTNWVNHHLSKRNCWVHDLFVDLRNGYLLVRLLESLTNELLGFEFIESRLHWIQNVQRVLNFLRYRGIRIVNIRADEIVDGNPKLTLGLIWIIILHFQVTEVLQNQTGVSVSLNTNVPVDEVAKQSLLNWCRAVTTGYPGVFVRDFSTSWLDGRGFLTLIHRYRPELVDFHVVDRQSPAQNLELAFTLAERELHVVRLFDAEDLASTTDERSIITYIASLYEALATDSPSIPPLPALYRESVLEPVSLSHGSVVGHLPSDQSSALRTQWLEYRSLATELAQWLRLTTDRMNARNFPPDLKGVEQRVMGEIKRHRLEERPRRERERQQLIRMSEDLKPGIRAGHIPNDPFLRIEQINRLWDEYNTALEERELAALSDMRRLDRLQWAADRIVRECRAVESQLTALERRLVETEPSVTTMVDSQRGGRLCRWSEQLGALETKLNGLFNQVQHLRSGRYVHTEQIYRDVCTLHQRFLDLQRRLRQQSNPSEPNGTKALNSSQVNLSHPAYLPKGLAPGCQDQRYEFLTPIQRCLVWIDEHVNLVKDGSYGNSIQSVEAACRKHEQTIREVAYFRNEIERCRKSQLKATRTPEEKKLSEESMQTLDHAYQQLLEMCDHRTRLSHSLLDFVRRATHQLDWLRAHEASEVHRDWSRPDQLNSGEIRRTLQELVKELKLREPGFSDLSVAGTSMQLDNHPASDLIQAYVIALERHWAWLVQLIGCSESRLEQLMRQESHTSQVAECESILTTQLHDMQLLLGRSCKRSSTMEVDRLRTQLQHIATQLNDYESLINGLMVEAQDIVPLSVDIDESASPGSSLDHRHIGSRVRPLCCFRSADYWFDKPNTTYESVMGETFWPKGSDAAEFDKGDALVLVGTTDTKMSNLRTATGTCLQTPIVCFLPSWPCAEAIERTRYLMNFLNKVKSCLTLADLSLRGEVLCACMNAWRDGDTNQPFTVEGFEEAKRIYVDGLRHSLALRLANQPSDEIERFETELARFDNLLTSTSVPPDQTESVAYSELRQVMGQLRRAVNTLASQLQQRCASSLPDRISELERRIQEHKAWVKDLAHIQSRSLEFQQKLQRSENLTLDGQASPIIIQAQALGDTASQLHVAGQAYSQLLADTDAWLARLNRADEVLGECELSLLGSAIHIHGLFPSLGTLEPANHDGLRAESVERAHKDLKAIAERLPRVRAELDLLSQQVPDVNKLTLSENRDPHVTREFLRLLLPVDNQVLLPRLNICHQRLAAAMREVELELKAFGDSLRCFPTYQSLHDDLLHQSTEFKNRIVELSELVRSIGLESGSDETLIKAALGQADQIAAEVDDQLVKVEQLNRHIAQMILVLTNYAKATQNYRQLVETTFQQSGASRDYRWSPGFGLFDITQILRNADQITDRYNDHAQQVYDQIQCLYNVLRHSGYGGHLQLTHVPRALTYRQIYPGEFPPEFPQRRSITPDQAFRPGSTPSIPVSLRTSGSRLPITDYTYVNGEHQTNWELRLDCIETESVVALPNGWDFPPDLNTDRAFWSRLKKPMPTSGAWFVTRLSEFDSEGCRDEPLCIGDALRRGLIDPRSQTCQPSSKASSMSISWKEAVERGWLTDQASRALSDPIRTPRGLYCPLASLILRPGEFNQTDGVDPATGNYWPEQQKLVELWMESKLSSSDFTRLAAVLSSGIAVEYRESRVCWCDASCEKQSPSMVKPCLSDWLSAGAYNPATRRLRVSILKDNSTANMEKKLFCEDELTIKQCIELGLIDPHMPEVIVPMETSSESARTTPYRRITLNTAISVGLIDDVDGLWCGISQWADVSVSLHVAHTAGLISRAPSLSEALLAGLLALDRVDENGQLRSGLVDTHTGSHMSFSEAIQRGLVQGNCPSLMLLRASHVKTHSLTEALRLGIINELGEFQLHNGSSVTLWDAVNSGLVRLVHTQVYPPPVGVLQPKLARKQQYHQHPVLQAIRTNLLDAGSEEILLSEAEAKQHGLSPTMRRILLRKSPRISHLCDVQTVNLLTRSSGLIYPDGRELTGLEALARGWLIPCSSSPPGSRQYGQVIDPTTDLAVDVVAGTTWPPTRPLSTNGAHLLLGLSSHRPYRGYLMIQRLITKLSWLGPGLHDDNLVKPTLLTNLPRVPSSTSLGHQWRPEQILSVLDPSSARHLSPSEAIRRNLLDLDSGVFRFPDTGRTISLGDAVGQKLVQVSRSKPPKKSLHNGSASSLFGRKRPPSPSSSSIKKRPALTPLASLRKLLRSQSPGRSSVHSDVSDRTNTLSRSEKSDERSLRSKDTITNRFFAKLATLGSRSSNECPATEVEKVSKPRLQHRLELLERNCVLYAFYYLHDEVRVEAAITESMLREGRVDVRQGVVCDPLSGRFVPAPEALANGFVFGIVFTKAGRVPPESGVEDTAPDHTSSSREPLFWLEVFHRRHDIYQLERVYDPYDKKLVAVTDAVAKGVVDPIHCTYTHPVTGDLYSIEDALYCGWIQALPVGNPPPFELKGRQFDHIHVRTVEEGYTFTSITRTIPYVTIHRHFVPSPSPKLADMISDGIHTTRSLKRHMFGEPTPRMYVGTRGSGEPLPVCHLKPGYQLTPGGEVEIIATGERVSVPDAISRNYAVPATPAQSAENSQLLPEPRSPLRQPRFTSDILDQPSGLRTTFDAPRFDPSTPTPLSDGDLVPAMSLSLVRYQRMSKLPTVHERQPSWPTRFITLETAIKRGWLDPISGQLYTHSGRSSRLTLMDAVEQGMIDPMQILVRVVQPMETEVPDQALYSDQPVMYYYSLAVVLDALVTMSHAKDNPKPLQIWNRKLLTMLLKAASSSPLMSTGGKMEIIQQHTLTRTDYDQLQTLLVRTDPTTELETIDVTTPQPNRYTRIRTVKQLLEHQQNEDRIAVIHEQRQITLRDALSNQLLQTSTPIIEQTDSDNIPTAYTALSENLELVAIRPNTTNQMISKEPNISHIKPTDKNAPGPTLKRTHQLLDTQEYEKPRRALATIPTPDSSAAEEAESLAAGASPLLPVKDSGAIIPGCPSSCVRVLHSKNLFTHRGPVLLVLQGGAMSQAGVWATRLLLHPQHGLRSGSQIDLVRKAHELGYAVALIHGGDYGPNEAELDTIELISALSRPIPQAADCVLPEVKQLTTQLTGSELKSNATRVE
ncbi:Plectin [Clonorchis sinensis]|uniref:Plectin n=1 Tax=Clonorchis sinensis TaxID=79923 RepID=A0A8T1M8R2_CLOSI|nr:Plectin [Clonorchis sinensis]